MAEKLEVARALAALGVDVIEAGFPDRLARRLRGRARHRRRGHRLVGLRPGPLQRPRHRPRLGGAPVRPEAADPRLPGHLRHPSRAQAADDQGRRSSSGPSPSVRRAKGYCAGHRVQPRGRRADRARLPLRGRRGRHRGRRHHGQHPRHGRLRHARSSTPRSSARSRSACRTSTRRSSASTATTTSAWPSPTAWPAARPARGRSSARSTASANAPATPRSKRS